MASIVTIVCLVLGSARILLKEDLESRRGALIYFMTITSRTIVQFPIIKPTSEVVFSSSPGDGPEPPSQSLHYASGENRDVLSRIVADYLLGSGYQEIGKKGFFWGGTVFKKEGIEFELHIGSVDGGGSEIDAKELYWYRTAVDDSSWQ